MNNFYEICKPTINLLHEKTTMNSLYTTFWDKCLNIIRDNVNETSFSTWFEPIIPIKYENNVFTIQVPSQFFYEYIEAQYADLLKSTLNRVIAPNTKLVYRVVVDNNNKKNGTTDVPGTEKAPFQGKKKIGVPEFDSYLNFNYHFDNFVEGDCNRLPRTAGINIASQPGKTIFNPLFIYGKSGVGKTHLANAIGLKTKELHPQKKVLYVSANLFQLQYTEASRNNQINDFLNFYQLIDVLIIDDIHELGEGKKVSTQNTFFHIFNHLHQSGKQLIITCDKKPAELEGLEDRLLTRFKWGLSAEIEKPDFETRKAILLSKTERDGLKIPDNVLSFIAEHITDSIRDLEGAIISLIAQSTMNQKVINLDLAKKVVRNLVNVTEKKHTIKNIRDLVCEYFKIPVESLQSSSRKREVVQARHIAMYFSKQLTQESLTSIGNSIGKRNHATVIHACKTVKDLMDTDKTFRGNVLEIEKKLTF